MVGGERKKRVTTFSDLWWTPARPGGLQTEKSWWRRGQCLSSDGFLSQELSSAGSSRTRSPEVTPGLLSFPPPPGPALLCPRRTDSPDRQCPGAVPASVGQQLGKDSSHFCFFASMLLHQGAELKVQTKSSENPCEEVLTFRNSGQEGSGPRNFSCVLYNANSMNCSWKPGPTAPASVQYRLDVWTKMYRRWTPGSEEEEDMAECPQYVEDSAGRQVGCHFPQLSQLTSRQFHFFLNGSSPEAAIPFLDTLGLYEYQLEKYNPPRNITIHYNGSNYIIRWANPPRRLESTGAHILQYELDIRRQVVQKGEDTNVYLVPSTESRGRHSVRIRVRHKHGTFWSEWSPTLTFGLPEEHANYTVMIVPAVVATMVAAVVLILLFVRSPGKKTTYLHMPRNLNTLLWKKQDNMQMDRGSTNVTSENLPSTCGLTLIMMLFVKRC
ncbi:PREDICTED: granulocyte-macrophage colony-stimulating factor receptor subunit alpha-like [Elephantulus edwardii]|uniref:granulocyte-macrophage colony-stimulating factor receptor subunit alpha-like n=1 Tax=Elephantulus edwardii TaxID=28737 RepID=UPI0003F08545|nr:PREDICTED: granulocyte-macrophage colony-stimulating factor receptor subunit alpha-like [Elephantulus edwardii]